MQTSTISRRYATALIKIAQKKNALEKFGQELSNAAAVLAPSMDSLAGPLLKKELKKEAIDTAGKTLGLSPETVNFLKLLTDKGRLAALPGIVEAYRVLADEAAGKVTARVWSALKLDEATLGQLRVKLTKRLGKTVTIETKTDPALIGGLRTQVGSLVIDGTLAGHLERFAGLIRKG